ncbi:MULTISPECIES: hypothetical protein [unclassified Streptomyces]|uniref:hypothetical protein n=1 Tax=unclassified Streptomyces TaxID=2593676 RepID=UPI002E29536C|nr:hypothetical protein [Streptomyces sp. NBC_00228]
MLTNAVTNHGVGSVAAKTSASQSDRLVTGSPTVLVVVAVLVGLIFGFLAGLLHKKDGAATAGAVIRGAKAWVGSTTLCLAICFSSHLMLTLVVLLVSVIFGIGMAILYNVEGETVLASVWRGAVAFVAVATLGNGVLAVYDGTPAQSATVAQAEYRGRA